MRSVENAVILVTGATDGLGKMVARDLAQKGATVLIHGRGEERAASALRGIREETGSEKLEYYLADFDDVMLERGYEGMRAYSQSKLAQIMFTFDLAGQLAGSGVTVNALHPASLMDTKMVHESFGYTLSTTAQGAAATERLALAPELEKVTGGYFDQTREARANDQAYDREARVRLRRLSEQLTRART